MVELHREGSAPAAYAAGLFDRKGDYKVLNITKGSNPVNNLLLFGFILNGLDPLPPVFNRPGVAGAALYTALLLISSLIQ